VVTVSGGSDSWSHSSKLNTVLTAEYLVKMQGTDSAAEDGSGHADDPGLHVESMPTRYIYGLDPYTTLRDGKMFCVQTFH